MLTNYHECDLCGRKWTHKFCQLIEPVLTKNRCNDCCIKTGRPPFVIPDFGDQVFYEDSFESEVRSIRESAGIID